MSIITLNIFYRLSGIRVLKFAFLRFYFPPTALSHCIIQIRTWRWWHFYVNASLQQRRNGKKVAQLRENEAWIRATLEQAYFAAFHHFSMFSTPLFATFCQCLARCVISLMFERLSVALEDVGSIPACRPLLNLCRLAWKFRPKYIQPPCVIRPCLTFGLK